MQGQEASFGTFKVDVLATNNRTRTPEEIAELALNKLIHISDSAPPVLKEQAIAYKNNVRHLLTYYIRDAVKEERMACAMLASSNSEISQLILSRN